MTNTLFFFFIGAMVAFLFRSSRLGQRQTVCEHQNREETAALLHSKDRLCQEWRFTWWGEAALLSGLSDISMHLLFGLALIKTDLV